MPLTESSWIGFLFLSGLYISSLSSILGSLYGAPRVLQSIAAENVIPPIKRLEIGRGPNKVPVFSTLVVVAIACVFIMIARLNILAMLSTLPFLLTYTFVNYAYVSLAMTYDLQQQREIRYVSQMPPQSYGSTDKLKTGNADLDQLFPERQKFGTTTVSAGPETSGKEDSANASLLDPNKEPEKPIIIHQPRSWYSFLCNRWLALAGAVVNIVLLFLIHWLFALLHIVLLFLLYFYIGRANPGIFPGISEFSIPHSVQTVFNKWFRKGPAPDDHVIVTPLHPGVETLASRLTENNADYTQRPQYHQSQKHQLDDFD